MPRNGPDRMDLGCAPAGTIARFTPLITPLLRHRMTAIEDCDVLEVSTTELDDVVRLQDNYGREGTSKP